MLGCGDTSMATAFSARKELQSEEEMVLKSLLCVVRRDNVKTFAKLGEWRGGQVRIELSPSMNAARNIPSRSHSLLDKGNGTMQREGASLCRRNCSCKGRELEARGAFGVCPVL